MTRKKKNKQKIRRERVFTTPETLSLHPIVRLFDNSAIAEVLSLRGERGLRFSDMQYLLCDEKPTTTPRNCPKASSCEDCSMVDRCLYDLPGVWSTRFSEIDLESMKVYSRKAHLADDLSRLCDQDYLCRIKRGLYMLSRDAMRRYAVPALKKYLGKVVNECPDEFVHIDESAYFLFLEKDLVENSEEDFRDLCTLVDQVRRKLGELMMRSILNDVSKAFRKELSRLEDDREKVYLQRYLKDHISIQLANLGLGEKQFKEELSTIHNAELNIDGSEHRRIEKEVEVEKKTVRKAKRRISEAFWLERKRSPWAEKYESLMERADEGPSTDEIDRVKEILRKEEDFQKRFHDSDMCIRHNALKNSPFIVMEYSPFILPVCESEAEGGESEVGK